METTCISFSQTNHSPAGFGIYPRSTLESVQFGHSVVSDSGTPWTVACQASLSITNSRSLPKLWSFESVMPSNHLILCRPLLLPSAFPSIRVSSSGSVLCIRWPKYWSCSFNISPSNEHPGLISFRRDWLDLLAVQGTLKSLLQHHSSKASIRQHSAFFFPCLYTSVITLMVPKWGVSLPLISQLLKPGSVFILFFKCSHWLFFVVHRLSSSSRAQVLVVANGLSS